MRRDSITLQHTATHCNTLQHAATHCDTLRHTATHCNTLQHTATPQARGQFDSSGVRQRNTPQHAATRCNTLQHAATRCNTLQHVATHCNTLQHAATHCNTANQGKFDSRWQEAAPHNAPHHSTWPQTATHCTTLQHTAAHCNTLQHTATHRKPTASSIPVLRGSVGLNMSLSRTPNFGFFCQKRPAELGHRAEFLYLCWHPHLCVRAFFCQKRPAELGYRAEFGPSEAHCKCPQQMDKVLAIYDNVFALSHFSSTTTDGRALPIRLSPGRQTINKIFFAHLPLFVMKVHTKPKNGLKQYRPLLMVPT